MQKLMEYLHLLSQFDLDARRAIDFLNEDESLTKEKTRKLFELCNCDIKIAEKRLSQMYSELSEEEKLHPFLREKSKWYEETIKTFQELFDFRKKEKFAPKQTRTTN